MEPNIEALLSAEVDNRLVQSLERERLQALCLGALGQARHLTQLLASAYGDLGRLRVELALAKAPPAPAEPAAEHFQWAQELEAQSRTLASIRAAVSP